MVVWNWHEGLTLTFEEGVSWYTSQKVSSWAKAKIDMFYFSVYRSGNRNELDIMKGIVYDRGRGLFL